MFEDRERKRTSKGPLMEVKCQQTNAHTSAIFPVFSKWRESISLQKFCFGAGSIALQSFPNFRNLSESCLEKGVFVQLSIALHSTRSFLKRHRNYHRKVSQIVILPEPCITNLCRILTSFRAKPKLIGNDANAFVKALF